MSVIITKTNGGLARRSPSDDNIMGMVINGVATANLVLGTVYVLTSLKDLEDKLVDAAYDTTNVVLVHYHVSEFFRMNPSGTLYIQVVAQSVTLTQMALKSNAYLKKLLTEAVGKVKVAALVRCPASGYTPTINNGLDGDVLTVTGGVRTGAVINAQALADEEASESRPIDCIIIEGRSYVGVVGSVSDLTLCASAQIGVFIGQDKTIADGNALFNGMAAVGTLLGLIGATKVGESIAWVQKGNIQSGADSAFLVPALSSHAELKTYIASDFVNLAAKGFMFCYIYPSYDGVYVKGEPTATLATSDYSELRLNRTINKAIRTIYQSIMPDVASPLPIDPATGKLTPEVCTYFENKGNAVLENMGRDQEISGGKCYVDPSQNVLSGSGLEVDMNITPLGKADPIKVKIGFVNPFN